MNRKLGKEIKPFALNEEDKKQLTSYLTEYAADFSLDMQKIFEKPFIKLVPHTHRPYGKLYAY